MVCFLLDRLSEWIVCLRKWFCLRRMAADDFVLLCSSFSKRGMCFFGNHFY
jgi:hypothetical protein